MAIDKIAIITQNLKVSSGLKYFVLSEINGDLILLNYSVIII